MSVGVRQFEQRPRQQQIRLRFWIFLLGIGTLGVLASAMQLETPTPASTGVSYLLDDLERDQRRQTLNTDDLMFLLSFFSMLLGGLGIVSEMCTKSFED